MAGITWGHISNKIKAFGAIASAMAMTTLAAIAAVGAFAAAGFAKMFAGTVLGTSLSAVAVNAGLVTLILGLPALLLGLYGYSQVAYSKKDKKA